MIYFLGGKKNAAGTYRTGLGNGFRGLLDYLVYGDEDVDSHGVRADHVGTVNLWSSTPELASFEMRRTANGLPSCETPVYHFGIALEPGDAGKELDRETLSTDQWQAVVEHFLVRLGLGRALKVINPELFEGLREGGHLTRDARMKERKKPGRRGARRGFQFSKR